MTKHIKTSYNNGDTPYILVDTGKDYLYRGDVTGPIGIAEAIAHKTGGRVEVKDTRELPVEEIGQPDFILQSSNASHGWLWGDLTTEYQSKQKMAVMTYDDNEQLFESFRLKQKYPFLVASHINPEKLKKEGEVFAKQFALLPRPLTGILLAHTTKETANAFAEKVWNTLKDFNQGTLFLCPLKRTLRREVFRLENALSKKFFGAGKLSLRHIFNGRSNLLLKTAQRRYMPEDYNPYIGLLDQADHLAIVGHSYSMMSDVVATGKTLNMLNPDGDEYVALKKDGYVRDLFEHSTLKTETLTPPESTANIIADHLIKKYAEIQHTEKSGKKYRIHPLG